MVKNNTLNLIKAIAAISVVFIHIKFPNEAGNIITSLARFAVPFFFMTSGYFAYQSNYNKERNLRNIKKILKITLFALIGYFIWKIIYYNYYGNLDLLYNRLTDKEFIKIFFQYNKTVLGMHLWYLLALIYIYIMYYFIDKYKVHKVSYYLIPLILIINILLGEITIFNNIKIEYETTRNFMLTGFPFFMLGNLIKYSKEKIKYNNLVLIIFIIIFIITSILEFYKIGTCDLYISTIFLSITLFILGIQNPNLIGNKNILAVIGDKYSLTIFILQIIVIDAFKIWSYPANNIYFEYAEPILIIFILIIISIIYDKIKRKLKTSIS